MLHMELLNLSDQDDNFQQDVASLAQRSGATSAYPRPDFISLDQYLKVSTHPRSPMPSPNLIASDTDILSNFVVTHNLRTGYCTAFGPMLSEIARFANLDVAQEPCLLFMRGHASPQWLNAVGQKLEVNPELYRRHLHKDFGMGGRELHSFPSLPSSCSKVFQLTISTICFRNVSISPELEDLQEARRLDSEALGRYLQDLRSKAKVVDSIVRKCLLFSKQEYVLEQTVTVEVGSSRCPWRAVIWLDSGKDLSQSASGPWSPLPGTRPWVTYFSPVIVHQPPIIHCQSTAQCFTYSLHLLNLCTTVQQNPSPSTVWKGDQNICLLPFQYGAGLDKETAAKDALYSLSELFQFAASSEVQFLNFLQSHIEHQLSFIENQTLGRQNAIALLNLKYIKSHLARHAQRLEETITMLENHHRLDWPTAPDSDVAHQTAKLLLTDFKYLHRRAEAIAKECEQGMATLVNSSVLEESRRMTDNAERVRKLTILATTFIPLTFTCSIYGMNFQELGTGDLKIWVWFATAVPLSLISFFVYYFDMLAKVVRVAKETNDLH